jgi:CRP-like cAMP-binding protein
MDGGGRSATVTAIEPCIGYVLPAERFRRIITEAGLQAHLLRHIMARHREGDAIRAELAALPTLQRVARALLRHAGPASTRQMIEIRLSQQELALSVGVSRSALAYELARLRDLGLVSTGRRRITILSWTGLQAACGADHTGR